ncbi:hypothetical protein [Sinorhizobium meliloti]|uniref:hypothetical protein n=1 Tax=Rhizobium meliloti TaxID=382 RepID=UPI000FDC9FAD|nr:hypothetical protein [Sinorhizobium meliloti]RVG88709.1 hypothetical protein CN219_03830 [Sinorhizobium meliloti]RVI39009.1 hypothetical protein CN197_02405 [Sinorhizobium meliloti]RVI46645.1 hypothetical protein CN196_09255 [Sinorhizobium meliloti]RVJ25646.1 hypothetical protein CN177_13295 [Sinorhizobium meliloti]RVK02275.1 hypothetical protein CN170_08835 [Sinorhizobium meliloti]
MSGHTPGPWTTRQQFANRWLIEKDQGSNDAGEKLIPLCLAAVHTTILEVGCGERDTEANARLIAAAPDLLQLAFQYRDDLRHPPSPDSRERRLAAIEAVLSKAEGRS